MSYPSDIKSRIEAIIAGDSTTYNGVYARTNRNPVDTRAVTTDAGWSATTGNLNSLDVSEDQLIGAHFYDSTTGEARRISDNGLTDASANTSVTVAPAFATTPGTADAGFVRDGFTLCPDSKRLESLTKDRFFQVRLQGVSRDSAFGVRKMGRMTLRFAVLVAYQYDHDPGDTWTRITEDMQEITDAVLQTGTMVAGANIIADEEGSSEYLADEGGMWTIWQIPLTATYTQATSE